MEAISSSFLQICFAFSSRITMAGLMEIFFLPSPLLEPPPLFMPGTEERDTETDVIRNASDAKKKSIPSLSPF